MIITIFAVMKRISIRVDETIDGAIESILLDLESKDIRVTKSLLMRTILLCGIRQVNMRISEGRLFGGFDEDEEADD